MSRGKRALALVALAVAVAGIASPAVADSHFPSAAPAFSPYDSHFPIAAGLVTQGRQGPAQQPDATRQ
ncbi:hypothetical protein [Streptomyces sp. CT34]|uniref:hypothetical protein n=1 Tax=Streptomyces sp. CT34 TaxID=1553907 RepID=UPI0012FF45FF|nr:hypothetical protein [Streptomyces sp. CT34]